MQRVFQLLGLAAILGLSACGKSEPPVNPGEERRKFQEDMFQAKLKAGQEALAAEKFDDAIASLNEAALIGRMDEAASEMLDKAKAGKRRALVAAGHDAMKKGDHETARKAYADALAISIDDDVRRFLDEAITRAWRQAGAKVEWMRVNGQGVTFSLEVQPEEFVPPKNKAHEYYRSFKFSAWKSGILPSLPAPQESFGLDLSFTSFNDDAIPELSWLKSIYILDVRFTKLTNEGRERLRKTVFVQWLTL